MNCKNFDMQSVITSIPKFGSSGFYNNSSIPHIQSNFLFFVLILCTDRCRLPYSGSSLCDILTIEFFSFFFSILYTHNIIDDFNATTTIRIYKKQFFFSFLIILRSSVDLHFKHLIKPSHCAHLLEQ